MPLYWTVWGGEARSSSCRRYWFANPSEATISIAPSSSPYVRVIESNADLHGVEGGDFDFGDTRATLVLAFVSGSVDFDAVTSALAQRCAPTPLLAVSTAGELCATAGAAWYCRQPSVVVQIFAPQLVAAVSLHSVALPRGALRRRAPPISREQHIRRLSTALNDVTPAFALDARDTLALTFIDGVAANESLFIEAVYRCGRFPCLFVGGMASGELPRGETPIFDGRRRVDNHAVMAFIKLAPGKCYGIFKSHNFRKTEVAFSVLDVDATRHCVQSLIDPASGAVATAASAVAKALCCSVEALERRLEGHSFGIDIDGELCVRSLARVDVEQGTLTFFGDVNPGDELFVVSAGDFVEQTEGDLALFLQDKPAPIAGILNDCFLRRTQNPSRLSELGQGWLIPVAGFSTFGELLGIKLNQTLVGVFFFESGGRPFHDALVDAFPLMYARYNNHFTQCRLKRAEILNGLRSGLMRLLLDDAHVALSREDGALGGGGRELGASLAAIREALQAAAWDGDDASDIESMMTYRRRYEENLWRQANFDDLTGLPNRVLMLDRLGQSIAQAQRANVSSALLYLDLDRFKHVNDSQGHAVGDALLRELAQRLQKCIREGDSLARLGGDEFVIILPNVSRAYQAAKVAEHAIRAISRPFEINDATQSVTVSIGIALFPTDGLDSQTLLRNADLAMYKAKESGRNGYRFFTQALNTKLLRRSAQEARLCGALERGEMRRYYQPIVDLKSGAVVALECLLRWQDEDGRLCLPGEFMPLAEEAGLVNRFGDWVLENVCRDMRGDLPDDIRPPRVAVNVSPRQLHAPEFADRVAALLVDYAIAPSRLELEITESVLMDERLEIVRNLTRLGEIGVRLSIDDFGLGYASLAHLQRYPLSALKIDVSFIHRMIEDPKTGHLVEAVIAMGHAMGWQVIAEGVESEAQRNFLQTLHGDLAQGYWFGRPQPAA